MSATMTRRERRIQKAAEAWAKRTQITPELLHALCRAKERADAGITSSLEAGCEQIEAILAANPSPALQWLVDALRDFIDGDSAALDEFVQALRRAKQ